MKNKIILAADEIQDLQTLLNLIKKIGPNLYAVKIHNLYDKYGPDIVAQLKEAGASKVWVDAKLYDIPNTVGLRAESITADIITVHASGGVEMMKKAVASGKEIYAVTILTSFSAEQVQHIYNNEIPEQVLLLAKMAKEAGVAGIVCSAHEVKALSSLPELQGLEFVVPGIRSTGVPKNDQERAATPADATTNGATRLVIGRQITQAEDPEVAVNAVLEELQTIAA